jgi:hypothetical protein
MSFSQLTHFRQIHSKPSTPNVRRKCLISFNCQLEEAYLLNKQSAYDSLILSCERNNLNETPLAVSV